MKREHRGIFRSLTPIAIFLQPFRLISVALAAHRAANGAMRVLRDSLLQSVGCGDTIWINWKRKGFGYGIAGD